MTWKKAKLLSKEQGLFIVRNGEGALNVVTGDFKNTYKSIVMDASVIPDGLSLVATVNTHPRSSFPSYRADYPAFDSQEALRGGWAIVIGESHSYFVSPSQRTPGFVRFNNKGLLWK